MPYSIVVEDGGRGVIVTWNGPVSGAAIMAANEEMYAQDTDVFDHSGSPRVGVEHMTEAQSTLTRRTIPWPPT